MPVATLCKPRCSFVPAHPATAKSGPAGFVQHPFRSRLPAGKDPLFARLTLAEEELKLYEQLYRHLRPQALQPDLVIYLQAGPETLVERIRKRGNPMEALISTEYLQRLCDSYSHFFYHYDAAPILIVNNEHLNLSEHEEDFELLLSHIAEMRGKRAF